MEKLQVADLSVDLKRLFVTDFTSVEVHYADEISTLVARGGEDQPVTDKLVGQYIPWRSTSLSQTSLPVSGLMQSSEVPVLLEAGFLILPIRPPPPLLALAISPWVFSDVATSMPCESYRILVMGDGSSSLSHNSLPSKPGKPLEYPGSRNRSYWYPDVERNRRRSLSVHWHPCRCYDRTLVTQNHFSFGLGAIMGSRFSYQCCR